jgi:hypothetical protein
MEKHQGKLGEEGQKTYVASNKPLDLLTNFSIFTCPAAGRPLVRGCAEPETM